MRFKSTRNVGADCMVSPAQAVVNGLAPDGGLYVPEEFLKLTSDVAELAGMSEADVYTGVLRAFFPEFSVEVMRGIIDRSYGGKFAGGRIAPLKKVGDAYVMELFHGPTSAFKDVALSFLPQLLCACKAELGIDASTLILTATSGDTGKAALAGFSDVPGTGIGVFYPVDGVSEMQKAQMATHEAKNAFVCAIRGNFDDAQTAVKQAFCDAGLKKKLALSSANSINIGRLAPQVSYYFTAYGELLKSGVIRPGGKVDFVVPTGNFGDILAGYFAKLMGLPVGRLVCASNANRVLCDFIETGVYDKRRDFIKTASPSMDILVSSNLERLLYLITDRDAGLVGSFMRELREDGVYTIPAKAHARLKEAFLSGCRTDAQAFLTIRDVYEKHGYLLDPHTAVGYGVYEELKPSLSEATVVLATASPYKFPESMLSALGMPQAENSFAAVDALYARTKASVPQGLLALRQKRVVHTDVIDRTDVIPYIQRKAGDVL